MKLCVVAVGQRVPAWADAAWDDYAKRFPPELKVELRAIKTEPRTGGKTAAQAMAAEQNLSLLKQGKVKGFRLATLDAICRHLDCSPGDLLVYVPDGEGGARQED